jgi:hypothetical protein
LTLLAAEAGCAEVGLVIYVFVSTPAVASASLVDLARWLRRRKEDRR